MNSLNEVFEHELKDLYSAETQLIKALPKMAKAAMNSELRQALENHLQETQNHVQRLEKVAELCDVSLRGQKCKGMEGLLEEGSSLLSEEEQNEARDAAMIPAAQRVEHYEMAAYGSAVTFAKMLGMSDAEALLQQTLDEEKKADAKLSQIAEQSVNPSAMGNDGENNNGDSQGSTASGSKSSSSSRASKTTTASSTKRSG